MIHGEKIIISGASGFIGRHICQALAVQNTLYILGRNNLPEINCHFIETDFTKSFTVSKLPSSADRVIHLAGIVGNENEIKATFDINTNSTLQLLDYARQSGVKNFVFTSTGNTCGYSDLPITENSSINFDLSDFYSFSKSVAESLVHKYTKHFNTLIIRPFYPYGPNQPKNKILPRLIKNIVNSEPIATFNNGQNPKLSFIHIKDFTNIFLSSLELNHSETLNITGCEFFSIKEIAEMIGQRLNKKPIFIDKIDASVKNRIGDSQKVSSLLKINPTISFKEGLLEMIEVFS